MTGFAVDAHFEFREFDPEQALVREAHRVFEDLGNLSPYDALLEASIEYQAGEFIVSIDVHSSIGRFGIVTRSKEWHTALISAEAEMQRELHDWKGSSLEGRGNYKLAA